MSNTSITNVEITDTFQVWINKTNELIDLANENIMLAGPGAGFTIQGNSTLSGTFTANTLISSNGSVDNLNIANLQQISDPDEQILSTSPIKIETSVENIFDLQTSSGNRPILRMINGGNSRWVLGQTTETASSAFAIRTEGSPTPQISISQAGVLTAAVGFSGNGSLITNINANSISGTLGPNQIPDLNADKITGGTISNEVLPDSAKRNEISLPDLTNGNSSSQGFITGRRFRSALTWGNVSGKPTVFPPESHTHVAEDIVDGIISDARLPSNIVRDDRRLIGGTGINVTPGNGDLSADRTISAVQLTQAQATNSGSTVFGAVSGQRLAQAVNAFSQDVTTESVLNATAGASAGAVGTYVFARTTDDVDFGSTVSGSTLSATSAVAGFESIGLSASFPTTSTPSGTWRCMGRFTESITMQAFDPTRRIFGATLWLRIA